jgi:D-serine deaminase-like pyridoxal phosphate-dependent protein
VIIDNLEAFNKLEAALSSATKEIGVFVKIDTGYHRAGITTSSPNFPKLVEAVTSASKGTFFQGFYSHYGHSYAGSSEYHAATGLIDELLDLETACSALPMTYTGTKPILTVGATPTATRLKLKYVLELHAGVYPLLDCQQIATHARPSSSPASYGFQPLSKDSIAIRMLLEISSIYTERSKPEALVSAGSLALGRDPCKSYPGWGILSSDFANSGNKIYDETGDRTGWIVGRISQEHGILSWEGDREECKQFEVGDKIMVWPNHACVAGAGFGWYLVVDSEEGDGNEVVDVWCRWRGW